LKKRSKKPCFRRPALGSTKRFGFIAGQTKIPEDFNTMGAAEIEALFESEA